VVDDCGGEDKNAGVGHFLGPRALPRFMEGVMLKGGRKEDGEGRRMEKE
jgi:hypothetical protein